MQSSCAWDRFQHPNYDTSTKFTILQAAHRMNRFPPNTSILTSVKMTRTACAQLVGQKFFPPKVFGSWREPEDTKEWKWRDVGMKIVCTHLDLSMNITSDNFIQAVGFEMLFQESKGRAYVRNTSSEGNDASVSLPSPVYPHTHSFILGGSQ